MRRELVETPRFARALRRYATRDPRRQECVAETLLRMGANVFDVRLKTHGLSGDLERLYACSCGYDCRILFALVQDMKSKSETIVLLAVGSHDDIY